MVEARIHSENRNILIAGKPKDYTILTVGFALLRIWIICCIGMWARFSGAFGWQFGIDQVFLLCGALSALLIAIAANRIAGRRTADRTLGILNAVLLAVSVTGVLLATFLQSLPLAIAAFVLCGLDAGLFQVLWGRRFSAYDLKTALFASPTAAILTGLFFIVLPDVGGLIAFAVTPFISLGLLHLRKLPIRPSSENDAPVTHVKAEQQMLSSRDAVKFFISIGVFSFICRLLDAMPTSSDTSGPLAAGFAYWPLVIVGAVLLVCALLFKERFNPLLVYRLVLPLMVAGFVALSLAQHESSAFSVLLIGIGYEFFDVLFWVILTSMAHQKSVGYLKAFGYGTASTFIGMAFGRLAGRIMFERIAQGTLATMTASLVCIFVLVLLVALVIPENTFSRFSIAPGAVPTSDTSQADLAGRCSIIARKYSLTPREEEVLVLLAKGRTLAVIARELQIANGTARTHIGNIYQKLDVHKQQELIDLVEGKR